MNKIMTAVFATTLVAVAPAAFAKKAHHGGHAMTRSDGGAGATTGGSGGAVGQTGASQTGVNGQAGSGGAAGGMGR